MSEIEAIFFPEPSPEEMIKEDDLFEIFSNDLSKTNKAQELYASLCNNIWQSEKGRLKYSWRGAGEVVANLRNRLNPEPEDPKICQLCGKTANQHYRHRYKSGISAWTEKKGKDPVWLEKLLCSKDGENFTPGYIGKENYLDFYCSGNEGVAAGWVKEKLQKSGYFLFKER